MPVKESGKKSGPPNTLGARKRFAAAHKKGMAALRQHDYATLNEVIKEESEIIREQSLPMKHSARKQKATKAKKKR